MATEIKSIATTGTTGGTPSGVIDTTASVAATIANVIAPGSGVLVQKIVSKGGQIIAGIVDIFRRKKAQGMTDAQAMNDPELTAAKAAAAAELETLYSDSAAYNDRWAQFLGSLTYDDKVFIAMRKKAKMSGQTLPAAGVISKGVFSYGGQSLNVQGLNAYKPVFEGGYVANDGTVQAAQIVTTKDNMDSVEGGTSVQETRTERSDMMTGVIGMVVLGVIAYFLGGLDFIFGKMKSKRTARQRAAAKARAAKAAKAKENTQTTKKR